MSITLCSVILFASVFTVNQDQNIRLPKESDTSDY